MVASRKVRRTGKPIWNKRAGDFRSATAISSLAFALLETRSEILNRGSRSKSSKTSRITGTSIVRALETQPRDSALKQTLLMLRGIPSDFSEIRLIASFVKRGLEK